MGKPVWGAARVAVIGLKDEIVRDLQAGIPAAQIYRRHRAKLPDITSGAFQRQIRLMLKGQPQPATLPLVSTVETQPAVAGPIHVGRSDLCRDFDYTPPENTPDTRERLIGPRKPR